MAWIKMRHELLTEREVIGMADALGVRCETVVGYLFAVWSWFDKHSHAGSVTGVTLEAIESALRLPGFLNLMLEYGWLESSTSTGKLVISIPRWDEHNSQTAKARGLAQKRKQRQRCHDDVTLEEGQRRDQSKSKSKSKKNNETPIVPLDFFPEEFANDESVKAAYVEWFEYKRERGEAYKSDRGPNQVAKLLTDIGGELFKQQVSLSIRSNYSGVFAPKGGQSASETKSPPTLDDLYANSETHGDG